MEFYNHIIKELLETHKIKIHFTTPNHPESSGIIERFHSTIGEHIRLLKSRYDESLSQLMKYAVLAYNNSIHSATNLTPLELTLGHANSRNPYDIYYDKQMYSDYLQKYKEKLYLTYDRISDKLLNAKERIINKRNQQTNNPFKVGQTVYEISYKYKRNKTGEKFSGPYKITKMLEGNKALNKS